MKKIYGICKKCFGIVIITPSRSTDLNSVLCPNCGSMTSIDTTYSEKAEERVKELGDIVTRILGRSDLTDEDRKSVV